MLKRILSLLFCLVLLCSCAACAAPDGSTDSGSVASTGGETVSGTLERNDIGFGKEFYKVHSFNKNYK